MALRIPPDAVCAWSSIHRGAARDILFDIPLLQQVQARSAAAGRQNSLLSLLPHARGTNNGDNAVPPHYRDSAGFQGQGPEAGVAKLNLQDAAAIAKLNYNARASAGTESDPANSWDVSHAKDLLISVRARSLWRCSPLTQGCAGRRREWQMLWGGTQRILRGLTRWGNKAAVHNKIRLLRLQCAFRHQKPNQQWIGSTCKAKSTVFGFAAPDKLYHEPCGGQANTDSRPGGSLSLRILTMTNVTWKYCMCMPCICTPCHSINGVVTPLINKVGRMGTLLCLSYAYTCTSASHITPVDLKSLAT